MAPDTVRTFSSQLIDLTNRPSMVLSSQIHYFDISYENTIEPELILFCRKKG